MYRLDIEPDNDEPPNGGIQARRRRSYLHEFSYEAGSYHLHEFCQRGRRRLE